MHALWSNFLWYGRLNDPLSVKLRAVVIASTIYAVAMLCLTMHVHPAFVYGVCFNLGFNDATPLLTYKATEEIKLNLVIYVEILLGFLLYFVRMRKQAYQRCYLKRAL